MGLDIRLPMGVMFAILGAVLVFAGLFAQPASLQQSLGINLNLWWGLLILAFGLLMLLLSLLTARRVRRLPASERMSPAAPTRSGH